MSKVVTPLPANNAFVFQDLFVLANTLVSVLANEIVTANDGPGGGALSAGNGFVVGVFGANVVVASNLQGGNVTTTSTINLTSNLQSVGNQITVGNTVVNDSYVAVGNEVFINSSGIDIGNGTVFALANSTIVSLWDTTANINFIQTADLGLFWGNTTVNAAINSSGIFFDNVNIGEQVEANGPQYAVQYNTSTVFSGSAGLLFNPTTNSLFVSNSIQIDSGTYINSSGIYTNSSGTPYIVGAANTLQIWTAANNSSYVSPLVFALAQVPQPMTLTGNTVTFDMSAGRDFYVSLTANSTVANAINVIQGSTGTIKISQPAAGNCTLRWSPIYYFDGDTTFSIGTTANKNSYISYYVATNNSIILTLIALNCSG